MSVRCLRSSCGGECLFKTRCSKCKKQGEIKLEPLIQRIQELHHKIQVIEIQKEIDQQEIVNLKYRVKELEKITGITSVHISKFCIGFLYSMYMEISNALSYQIEQTGEAYKD